MEQPDFKNIAAQLRKPVGEEGIKTAIRMSENNTNMITTCIDTLHLSEGNKILELGFGGGFHLPYLFQKQSDLFYTGVDISETMIKLASDHNAVFIETGKVILQLETPGNGYVSIPVGDNHFERIFTVNTLYFWDNAVEQARELLRILKPGGQLAVCFADKTFMEQLPFTTYNFRLYTTEAAIALFKTLGCQDVSISEHKEVVSNTVNGDIERIFYILKAIK